MSITPVSITVPKEYGYVLSTVVGSFIVACWHPIRVGGFRRAAGVPYPIPYALKDLGPEHTNTGAKAKEEYLFNCAQRAHGHFLESYPIWLPAMLISGLKYPLLTTGLGASWLVMRIAYAVGYTDSNQTKGKGRVPAGLASSLTLLGLIGTAGKVAYDLATA